MSSYDAQYIVHWTVVLHLVRVQKSIFTISIMDVNLFQGILPFLLPFPPLPQASSLRDVCCQPRISGSWSSETSSLRRTQPPPRPIPSSSQAMPPGSLTTVWMQLKKGPYPSSLMERTAQRLLRCECVRVCFLWMWALVHSHCHPVSLPPLTQLPCLSQLHDW